jgi:hypothetical protein
MKQKILFIRTYIPSGMGGPLPPIELLSLASFIRKKSAAVEVRIIDTGLFSGSALDGVAGVLASFEPDVVYCGSLLWEAGLVHAIAAAARRSARPPFFIVSGQMAALLGEDLLRDPGIDCGIIGDGEETLTELLAVRSDRDIAGVRGIGLVKLLEDRHLLGLADARPRVDDADGDANRRGDRRGDRRNHRRRILQGRDLP